MLVCEKQFLTMEDQIPPSQPPMQQPLENQITPEMLAEMKARARELAIQQAIAQQSVAPQQQPKIIYLRRNFTVAELLLVILLSCGIVTGIQWAWGIATNVLPRIEIKMR
jgi:hypothetical protein